MRGEGIGKAKFRRQHRPEIARTQNPDRHIRPGRRHRLNALLGASFGQERLQFEHVLREMFGIPRRTAKGTQRKLVGAGRATQTEIDAARKQALQRPELLGDDIGRVVGQHNAAGADADGLRTRRNMRDHNRRRSTGNGRRIVMLRNPDTPVAPSLGMGGKVASIVQRAACVGFVGDMGCFKDGQCGHCSLLMELAIQRSDERARPEMEIGSVSS